MAWSQTDVDKLKKAIGSGVKRVEFDGHMVIYQDISEMINALKRMEAEVLALSTGPQPRSVFIQHGRGV